MYICDCFILVQTSGDAHTTCTYFNKLNRNNNFIFIKTQIERWIKWRKDWEPTNLDRNRASPLTAFTVLDGLCNWINSGESPEQTTDNKRKRSNQNNNQNLGFVGSTCWSRCSHRRRVWTPSRGLGAAFTVASVDTVSRRRSPAAGLGRLPLPTPQRPRLRRWPLEYLRHLRRHHRHQPPRHACLPRPRAEEGGRGAVSQSGDPPRV